MKIRRVFLLSLAACCVQSPAAALAQFGTSAMAPVPAYATAPSPVIVNQPVAPPPVVTAPPAGPPAFVGPPAYTDPYYSPAPGAVAGPAFGLPLLGGAAVPPDCDPVCGAPGIYFFVEALWWDAFFPDTPYAVEFDPANFFDARLFSAEFDDDTGWRVGAGWRFQDGWDIGASYTDFNTTGRAAVGPIPPAAERIPPLQILNSNPFFLTDLAIGGATDFDALTADAAREALSIDYQVIDIEAGRKYCICRTLVLRPFIGLRLAELDHNRTSTYFDFIAAGDVDTYQIANRTNISSIGPRLGTSVAWNIGGSGFQAFGRSALSLLFSDTSVRRTDTYINQSIATTTDVSYEQQIEEIVPVVELAVGLRYQWGRFMVDGGWELQNWFNVVTDARFHGDIDAPTGDLGFSGISLDRGDIGVGGWFLRVGSNY